jgi:predicted transcriptional regulator
MEKKRNRLQIIKDILEVIGSRNGKIKPTHILYKANLSHQMMSAILVELKSKQLIEEHEKNGNKTFSLTTKGQDFLRQYRLINDFTAFFGLE